MDSMPPRQTAPLERDEDDLNLGELLLTLWLPVLNHGLGLEPVSRRLAQAVPAGQCLWVHGLNQDHIAGFQYHGGLTLHRYGADPAPRCDHLVTQPGALASVPEFKDPTQWRLAATLPRLRANRDTYLLYERVPLQAER